MRTTKYRKICILCLFFAILGCDTSSTNGKITFKNLLNALSDRAQLTYFDKNYVAKAATSYDRRSKEKNKEDWFANRDANEFIRKEKKGQRIEHVMMESEGPGCVVRMWLPATTKGIIRIYLDGNKTPTIAMEATTLIGGSGLVGAPFSFKASDREVREYYEGRDFFKGNKFKENLDLRSHNFYLPIPYQRGCKITMELKNAIAYYYQINYRAYALGTPVETFHMDLIRKHRNTLNTVGKKLTTGNRTIQGNTFVKKDISLGGGQDFKIHIKGQKAIHKIQLVLSPSDYQQVLHSTVLSIAFDKKRTVWVPIGSFMGVGHSDKPNNTYFVSVDNQKRTLAMYYVMPFKNQATITIKNYWSNPIRIEQLAVVENNYEWNESSRYFYAAWFEKYKIQSKDKQDMNLVGIKESSGRFVGMSLSIFNYYSHWGNGRAAWWGEGDDKFYVDGAPFPSIFGTGTEDYFGYAWCRPEEFHKPFISQPNGGGNKKAGYTNNNRHHILDDVPFGKSLDFDMEVWSWTKEPLDYDVTTFFYAEKNAVINKTPNPETLKNYSFN